MKYPTREEIAAEIAALREIKPRVRKRSSFGGDHHAAIERQIQVLTERMTERAIERAADSEEWADNERDEAMAAFEWMAGSYTDYPRLVDEWKELEG
jgi:hypothetical protein